MKKATWLIAVFLAAASAFVAGQQPDRPSTVPGRYIVVFKDTVVDVPDLAAQLARAHGGTTLFIYEHALKGFAVALPEQAATALASNPNVAYVEPDSVVWAFGSQTGATWGLDRIDQRNLPLDNTYNYVHTGIGVTAYIIDTGIDISHTEFGGRARYGYDFVDNDAVADDCNGHGTHVSGTVGGATHGVAKAVQLVAVRVLDCNGSGTVSGVVAGIDWVTANTIKPAVANMSLGGGASSSLDTAVQNSIASGVSYAVAAGNGNIAGISQDACKYSPARVPEAMTVSATDSTDKKASWANYGSCVDWFAPGVNITSAWNTSNTATKTISGTSMATPHTTGVAALYLEANPAATPAEVRDALYNATTKGIVTSSNTANNDLLYSLFDSSAPTNLPPTASFTVATSGLTATFTDTSTDADGSVVAWSWNFGDGVTSAAQNPSHTYAASGTYTVKLTVTDNGGATGSSSQDVSVTSGSSGGFSLTASGYKVKGVQYADLAWSGATSTQVDVYRNGTRIVTTANDGAYTDNINKKGGGATYTYNVCEAGTNTCSNTATVVF